MRVLGRLIAPQPPAAEPVVIGGGGLRRDEPAEPGEVPA